MWLRPVSFSTRAGALWERLQRALECFREVGGEHPARTRGIMGCSTSTLPHTVSWKLTRSETPLLMFLQELMSDWSVSGTTKG